MQELLRLPATICTNLGCTVMLSFLALCTACSSQQQNTAVQKPVAAAQVAAVVALGRIEPEGEVIKLSVPNAEDSRVNQILVKEGDFVQKNQVIAILQGIERRQAEFQDAKVEVRLRQAELTKVLQGSAKKAQLSAQRSTVARLQAALESGKLQREAAVASAEAVLHNAQLNYKRQQTLFQEGVVGRTDWDTAQRELATAQATLAERKAELQQTITTLTAEIAQEKAELAELQEVRPVDVEIARAQLEKAKIAVEQRRANLRDAEVRVPVAGQILKINTRVGEQVNISQGIVELARTNRMFAIAEVPETAIAKIKRGQRATITSEYGGFTGEIQGTVEQIGLQIGQKALLEATANNPTTDRNDRVVAVKIRLDQKDNPKVAALTNMQVRVRLEI